MKKELYKKIIFNNTNDENKKNINNTILEYYKINDNGKYGIEIIKECKEKFLINLEKTIINNIKETENEIEELLNKIIQFEVTPISLEYIIEDIRYAENI